MGEERDKHALVVLGAEDLEQPVHEPPAVLTVQAIAAKISPGHLYTRDHALL